MKKLGKRFIAIFMSIAMCIATGTTVFAVAPNTSGNVTYYNLEVNSEGIVSCTDENGNKVSNISPKSISGYTNGVVSKNNPALVIYPDASDYGGMGITIKTSSSWRGNFRVDVGAYYVNSGKVEDVMRNVSITSNGENYFENLWHHTPSYVAFVFSNMPDNASINVEIWIYG